ncbi:MAG: cell wall hydrolase [Lachnospiraceae bacterium]
MNSDKFPDTIEDVVYQKGQYACVKDGNYFREPTERNWKMLDGCSKTAVCFRHMWFINLLDDWVSYI